MHYKDMLFAIWIMKQKHSAFRLIVILVFLKMLFGCVYVYLRFVASAMCNGETMHEWRWFNSMEFGSYQGIAPNPVIRQWKCRPIHKYLYSPDWVTVFLCMSRATPSTILNMYQIFIKRSIIQRTKHPDIGSRMAHWPLAQCNEMFLMVSKDLY